MTMGPVLIRCEARDLRSTGSRGIIMNTRKPLSAFVGRLQTARRISLIHYSLGQSRTESDRVRQSRTQMEKRKEEEGERYCQDIRYSAKALEFIEILPSRETCKKGRRVPREDPEEDFSIHGDDTAKRASTE